MERDRAGARELRLEGPSTGLSFPPLEGRCLGTASEVEEVRRGGRMTAGLSWMSGVEDVLNLEGSS